MRDPSLQVRTAVTEALQGIEYNGTPIPIFDFLTDDMSSFPRIILLPLSGSGARQSKCEFGSTWQLQIKISSAFAGNAMVTQDIVDDISDKILQILVPFSEPFLDLNDSSLAVWDVVASIPGSLVYEDKARKYVDKNLIISFTIQEN